MQFILAVFVIQIPDYHQLGESCGVAAGELIRWQVSMQCNIVTLQ